MFENLISSIKPLNVSAMEKCQFRLDHLTKPLNSLHYFEHIARQMAGITGNDRPQVHKKSVIVMAGDHGVVVEGVSQNPQTMTAEMILHSCQGNSVINVFSEHVAAQLILVDIGIATDLPEFTQVNCKKIAHGTKNITKQPAMTREQGLRAIEVGIEIAQTEINKGSRILGLGAMGIGNTISSTGIIACYSGKKVAELLGRGTGISQQLLDHKIRVVETALAVNQPNSKDAIDVLSKIGGLEIAGLVGAILGGAAGGAVVVLDGLATSAAALIAVKMAPQVKEYLVASDFAVEPAHKVALDLINVPGYLNLDMQLGDGTGATLGMSLINASLHVLDDMKTFDEAEVATAEDGPGTLKQKQAHDHSAPM